MDARYQAHDCWVLYGQFQYASGAASICQPYASEADFSTLRCDWRTSHLRTFRAGLFQALAVQDPTYNCLKDAQGTWLKGAFDAALMYPLLEMASFARVRFNPEVLEVLYVYNDGNPAPTTSSTTSSSCRNFCWCKRRVPLPAWPATMQRWWPVPCRPLTPACPSSSWQTPETAAAFFANCQILIGPHYPLPPAHSCT